MDHNNSLIQSVFNLESEKEVYRKRRVADLKKKNSMILTPQPSSIKPSTETMEYF